MTCLIADAKFALFFQSSKSKKTEQQIGFSRNLL